MTNIIIKLNPKSDVKSISLIHQGSNFMIRPRDTLCPRRRNRGLDRLPLPDVSLLVRDRAGEANLSPRAGRAVTILYVSWWAVQTQSSEHSAASINWQLGIFHLPDLFLKNQNRLSHRTQLAFPGSTSPWRSSPSNLGHICRLLLPYLCQEQNCEAQRDSSPIHQELPFRNRIVSLWDKPSIPLCTFFRNALKLYVSFFSLTYECSLTLPSLQGSC